MRTPERSIVRNGAHLLSRLLAVVLCCAGATCAQEPTVVDRQVARLVQQLKGDDFFDRRDAAKALAKIQPQRVSNKDLRKEVARAFRDLALDDPKPEFVRGLWVWGGKYSIPLLVQILEQSRPTSVPEGLCRVLGETRDPRAAQALAGKIGDFFCGREAQTALRTMGTVAEAPLLTVAPAADADVALAAVALLAECGTEASYPLLRKAMRSRNPQVRETAKQSLARIRDRVASGAPLVVARENPNSPFAAPSETSASDAILKADQGGAASAASGPGREQGDWSDVQIIMRSHSLAARGLPADPAFPSAGTIQLKPIVLNVRQDGLLDFFPQQMLAHLSGAPLRQFGMGYAERPLAVVAHSTANGALSELEVVDLIRGKSTGSSPGPANVLAVRVAPQCQRALTVSLEGEMMDSRSVITVWELSKDGLRQIKRWMPYAAENNPWQNSLGAEWADTTRLVSVNGEGELVCWTADKAKANYKVQLSRQVRSLAISPGGKYLAVVDRDGLTIYQAANGEALSQFPSHGAWGSLGFNESGTRVACHGGQFVWVWNLQRGRLETEVYCLNLTPRPGIEWLDEDHLLIGGTDVVDLNRQLVCWRYQAGQAVPLSFQGKLWYMLQSGSQFGLVPYHLPHQAAVEAARQVTEADLVLHPGDRVGLDLQLDASIRDNAGTVLQAVIQDSGLQLAQQADRTFVAMTSVETEEAYYQRFGSFPGENVTKVNVQKKVYQVKLDVDGKLAFEFRSTQNAPWHIDMQGDESVQQAVDRETEIESRYYFSGCKFPSRLVHPDKAGPLGTSSITPHGLR